MGMPKYICWNFNNCTVFIATFLPLFLPPPLSLSLCFLLHIRLFIVLYYSLDSSFKTRTKSTWLEMSIFSKHFITNTFQYSRCVTFFLTVYILNSELGHLEILTDLIRFFSSRFVVHTVTTFL